MHWFITITYRHICYYAMCGNTEKTVLTVPVTLDTLPGDAVSLCCDRLVATWKVCAVS